MLAYLHSRRGSGGLLSENRVRVLLRRLLSALAHIHAIGIIHRDVSLANVLLLEPDNLASAVLADFGFATKVKGGGGSSVDGHAVGTPEVRTDHTPAIFV